MKKLWTEEEAQNLPEYALLLILVCLTAVSTVGKMAVKVNNIYSNAGTNMSVPAGKPSFTGSSHGYTGTPPANPKSKMKKDDEKPKPTHPSR